LLLLPQGCPHRSCQVKDVRTPGRAGPRPGRRLRQRAEIGEHRHIKVCQLKPKQVGVLFDVRPHVAAW